MIIAKGLAKKVLLFFFVHFSALILLLLLTPTKVFASELVDITHKYGDLSAYNSTVTDSGDLSVTSAAALSGTNYGIQAVINDTTAIYGRINQTAPASNEFRLRFYVDTNSLTMADSDALPIVIWRGTNNPVWIAGNVELRYFTALGYQLFFQMNNDSNGWGSNDSFNITDAEHYVEMHITKASSNVASDGTAQWWVDGVDQGTLTGIDNFDLFADTTYFDMGPSYGIDAGTSGTIYLDNLEINDDGSAIGAHTVLGEIFNATHESGDLSSYDETAVDSGDLSVESSAALAGTNYGMQAVIDDATNIYGKMSSSITTNQYRLRFYLDPNSITMAEGDRFDVVQVVATNSPWPMSLFIELGYAGGNYNIRTFANDDESAWNKYTSQYTITDDPHYVEVLLQRESSDGSDDGRLTLWIDGLLKETKTDVDNFALLGNDPTHWTFGSFGRDAGTSGTIYLDEFAVNDNGAEIGEIVTFDSGWSYRFRYTIDNSGIGETLTDFPLNIDLANDAPAHFWSNVDSNGADIRIIDEDGTTNLTGQAHLEGWDYSNQKGNLWAKRTIAASGSTEFVYVYYGNPNISTYFSDTSKQNTYNDGYVGIWHLDETTTGNTDYKDATSSDLDSTGVKIDGAGSDRDAAGTADGAVQFDAVDDYIAIGDNNLLDPTNNMSVGAWVKLNQLASVKDQNLYFLNKQDGADPWASWNFVVYKADDTPALSWCNSGRTCYFSGYNAAAVTTDAWYYLVGVYDGSTLRFYLNGSATGTYTGSPTGTLLNSDAALNVGNFWSGGVATDTTVDEIRLSSVARSAEWIEYSYLSDLGNAGTADSTPSAPTIDNYNTGTWITDSTPTLQFDLTDPDSGDIIKYQIQIDDDSDFSLPVVDTTEGSGSAEPRNNVTYTPSTLSDGSYYWRVRAIDDDNKEGSWTTANGGSVAFSIDTTSPESLTLDSPGGNSYINEERPTFRWKAASDATAGLSKYTLTVDNGDTGDFTVDDIPATPSIGSEWTSATEYEVDKYKASYSGFSDNDDNSNYIDLQVKSSSTWGDTENNGALKEGNRSWSVRATDLANNTTSSSRTLFVDKNSPSTEVTKVNEQSFSENLITTDTTPTISGRVKDTLSGNSTSGSEQTRLDNEVAAGPKEVEIKIEKKGILDVYSLFSTSTINFINTYWVDDGSEIENNSNQKNPTTDKSDGKYADYSYSVSDELPRGEYKITVSGKDNAGNTSNKAFTLIVGKVSQVITPEIEEEIDRVIEEKYPDASKDEKEEIKEELIKQVVTEKESSKPNFIQKLIANILSLLTNVYLKVASALDSIGKGITQFAYKFRVKGASTVAVWFDDKPTQISDVAATEIGTDYAMITWKTNHYATSKVNYGPTYDYGNTVQSNEKVKDHNLLIEDLETGIKYFYEVMSQGNNYVYDARHELTTLVENNE